jgi:hypothetical protein
MANILLGWARKNRSTNLGLENVWLYFETETTLIKTTFSQPLDPPEDGFFIKQLQDVVTGNTDEWSQAELLQEEYDRRSEGSTLYYYYDPANYTGTPADDGDVIHYACFGPSGNQLVTEFSLPLEYAITPSGNLSSSTWYRSGNGEYSDITALTSSDPKYAVICDVCQMDLKVDSISVEVNGGDYDVTINATTSDGSIEFTDTSSVGTTWQTDPSFTYPIPTEEETIRFYIRDTDGCHEIYRDVVLKPSTEYTVKYRSEFKDYDGRDWRCDIERKGYSGAVTDLKPTANPLSITRGNRGGDKFGVIRGSEAKMGVVSETDFALVELFSAKDKEWRLKVWRDDDIGTPELYWTGFIATEDYQEVYKRAPYEVSLSFYDGLGRLKNYDFITDIELNHSRRSAIDIIAECLRVTGLTLDIDTFVKTYSVNDYTNHLYPLESYLVNTESFIKGDKSNTVYDVLEKVLKVQKAKIYQEYGKWKIIDRDQSENYNIKTYDTYGVIQEGERFYYRGTFDSDLGGDFGIGAGKLTGLASEDAVVGDAIGIATRTHSGFKGAFSYIDFDTGVLTVGKKYYVSCYVYVDASSTSNIVIGLLDNYNFTDVVNNEIPLNSFFDGSVELYKDRWQKLELTFTATSSNFYPRPYFDGTDTGTFNVWFDAIEYGEYIEPQKTIDFSTYKWVANPNMTFIPAWQKMTMKQKLDRRSGVVRNGKFELETETGFLNWRNPNSIIKKVSVPKQNTLEPAMKITGNGDDSPAFKVSSEEFRFDVTGDGVKFKLKLDYRGTGGAQRIFKMAVICGSNYLNSDGRWLSDETFITETIAADDQKTRTIEINTGLVGSSASIYMDIYQAYEADGGVIIEEVSLVPTVNDIVPKEQTLEFINDENYIHKPEEYSLDFGDTANFTNPQILFSNNLFSNADEEQVVSGWKLGIDGDITTLGDLIGGAIYNNYSQPTKQITGSLHGYIELSDILIEQGESYFINSDVYNVKTKQHRIEIYQTFGNLVENNYFEYYEDGTLVELENGNLALLES